MTTIQRGSFPPSQGLCEALELTGEHGALARQLAGLQDRISRQIADYAAQVRVLQAEVVRLRGRLVQARTALLWGLTRGDLHLASLSVPRQAAMARRLSLVSDALPAAQAVICQTGCVGHAHPWREADGLCRRTGEVCEGSAAADDTLLPAPSSTT